MKTKNFPEKKRQRQLGVLERLLSGLDDKEPTPKESGLIRTLEERTGSNLRGVRTKKRRGVGARAS